MCFSYRNMMIIVELQIQQTFSFNATLKLNHILTGALLEYLNSLTKLKL